MRWKFFALSKFFSTTKLLTFRKFFTFWKLFTFREIICWKLCILTNAADTRDPELNVGNLAPILDYTNFTHRGYIEEPLKFVAFNHMIQTHMIDDDATRVAKEISIEMKLNTKGCIYCSNFGPTYESHSEIEGEYWFGATNYGMFIQYEAKKGEPKMKVFISEVIKRVLLKDLPIPKIEGDDHIISRILPKSFTSDEEIKLPNSLEKLKSTLLLFLALLAIWNLMSFNQLIATNYHTSQYYSVYLSNSILEPSTIFALAFSMDF